MIVGEMWNTSGLDLPFILPCCLYSHLSSQTLVPQVSQQILHFRIAAVCVVEDFAEDLEIEYSIVLPCLCHCWKSEVCQRRNV
jgi:hypothetical protein